MKKIPSFLFCLQSPTQLFFFFGICFVCHFRWLSSVQPSWRKPCAFFVCPICSASHSIVSHPLVCRNHVIIFIFSWVPALLLASSKCHFFGTNITLLLKKIWSRKRKERSCAWYSIYVYIWSLANVVLSYCNFFDQTRFIAICCLGSRALFAIANESSEKSTVLINYENCWRWRLLCFDQYIIIWLFSVYTCYFAQFKLYVI